MNNHTFSVIKYNQLNQWYLSLVLPLKLINQFSEILIYDKDDYGYQRLPIKAHYNKIKNYFLEEKTSKILPTSIILGADNTDIDELLHYRDGNYSLTLNLDSKHKIFRVVDGQHRLMGLSEAAKTKPELLEYKLNVIIMLLDPNKRTLELEVFSDINGKSKPLKIDLIELAKHNYEILENNIQNLNRHISIKTAYHLKENIVDSVWTNAIKFEIHSEVVLGIVGVTAFCESIEPIVQYYISTNTTDNTSKHETIKYTNLVSKEIAIFVDDAWNIVASKWRSCFTKDFTKDYEGNLVKHFYKKDRYIQKTLGVKAINSILCDLVREYGLTKHSHDKLKEILAVSKIKNEDWILGGAFSGLSSESGFKKAKKLILNEL